MSELAPATQSARADAPREPRVVVVGGGYAGATIARELDAVADVTVVEPKDHFVHAVATLRATVDEAWEDKVFHSYDKLLERGRVIHDTARLVTPTQVRLSPVSTLDADYLVLATGTTYPFPAKYIEQQAWVARSRLARLREALAVTRDVLLVGGGPVGVELAGELLHAFPHLNITMVEREFDILPSPDYLPEFRTALHEQLEAAGVHFILGRQLAYWPSGDVGTLHDFTVHTTDGQRIDAQMWFRCFGNQQESDYLDAAFANVRRGDGRLAVQPTMQVEGFETVFAVGDVTDVPESKRAQAAIAHARVAAANIRSLIAGENPTATYTAAREQIVVPLGPTGGASQLQQPDGKRVVLGSEDTARIKGADLMTGPIEEILGLA